MGIFSLILFFLLHGIVTSVPFDELPTNMKCVEAVYCNMILGDIMNITQTEGEAASSEFNQTYFHALALLYTLNYLEPRISTAILTAVYRNESVTKENPFGITNITNYENIRAQLLQSGIDFLPTDETNWKEMVDKKQPILRPNTNVCQIKLDACVAGLSKHESDCVNWRAIPRVKLNCTSLAMWPEIVKARLTKSQTTCDQIPATCNAINNESENPAYLETEKKRVKRLNTEDDEEKHACFDDTPYDKLTVRKTIKVTKFGDYEHKGCGKVGAGSPSVSTPIPYYGDFEEEMKDIKFQYCPAGQFVRGIKVDEVHGTFGDLSHLGSDALGVGISLLGALGAVGLAVVIPMAAASDFTKDGVQDFDLDCSPPGQEKEGYEYCNGYIDKLSMDQSGRGHRKMPRHFFSLSGRCQDLEYEKPLPKGTNAGGNEVACGGLGLAICGWRSYRKGADIDPALLDELASLGNILITSTSFIGAATANVFPAFQAIAVGIAAILQVTLLVFKLLTKIIVGTYVHAVEIDCCKLQYQCHVHGMYVETDLFDRGKLLDSASEDAMYCKGMEVAHLITEDDESSYNEMLPTADRFLMKGAEARIREADLAHPTNDIAKKGRENCDIPDPKDVLIGNYAHLGDERATGFEDYQGSFNIKFGKLTKPVVVKAGLVTKYYQPIVLCGATRTFLTVTPKMCEFLDYKTCTAVRELVFVGLTMDDSDIELELSVGTNYTHPSTDCMMQGPLLEHFDIVCNLNQARDFGKPKKGCLDTEKVFGKVVDEKCSRKAKQKAFFQEKIVCPVWNHEQYMFTTFTDVLHELDLPSTVCDPKQTLAPALYKTTSGGFDRLHESEGAHVAFEVQYGVIFKKESEEAIEFISTNHKVVPLLDKLRPILKRLPTTNYDWSKFEMVMADKSRYNRQSKYVEAEQKLKPFQIVATCGGYTFLTKYLVYARVDNLGNCLDGYLPELPGSGIVNDDEKCSPQFVEIPEVSNCRAEDYYLPVKVNGSTAQFINNRKKAVTVGYTINVGVSWQGRAELYDYEIDYQSEQIAEKMFARMSKVGRSKSTHFSWGANGLEFWPLLTRGTEGKGKITVQKKRRLQLYQLIGICGKFTYYSDIVHQRVIHKNKCESGDGGFSCDEVDDDGGPFVPVIRKY